MSRSPFSGRRLIGKSPFLNLFLRVSLLDTKKEVTLGMTLLFYFYRGLIHDP